MLLLAFERGCLQRVTLPIHNYLMDGESPISDLTAQYREDLQERWFIQRDSPNRHKKSKGYLGRLAELLIAHWAESTAGLRVIGLEATGSKHDILTVSTGGSEGAIEVKFIGTMDSDFEKMLSRNIWAEARDVPTAGDFLLTRVYEAAIQLADYRHRETAIIVIDETAWNFGFDAAFCSDFEGSIDLRNPKLQSRNQRWLEYLQDLKQYYPNIESDLPSAISSLDEKRIFSLSAYWVLQEEMV